MRNHDRNGFNNLTKEAATARLNNSGLLALVPNITAVRFAGLALHLPIQGDNFHSTRDR